MISFMRNIIASVRQKKIDNYLENLKNKGLKIGEGTDILQPFFLDPDHCYLISIGRDCTFAPNVRLIAHDASTKTYLDFTRIGKITIGDRCFIGDSTIILPNVSIGSNTVIGSASLVNKDIPENSVAAGNPAKIICSLDEYIKRTEINAEEKGVFGEDYLIENITSQKKDEVLRSLDAGEGYIV